MNKPGPCGPGCSEKVVSMLKAVFNDTDKNGGSPLPYRTAEANYGKYQQTYLSDSEISLSYLIIPKQFRGFVMHLDLAVFKYISVIGN